MTSPSDDRQLLVLDEAECLALLRSAPIGRLAFTEGALPAVQPVSFAVAEGEIVIPTQVGSAVAAASRGAVVAFEVDEVDAGSWTGWNVTVVGPSRVITDARDVARLDGLGVRSWAPGAERCYVSVRIRVVCGRRVHRAPGASPAGPAAGAGGRRTAVRG